MIPKTKEFKKELPKHLGNKALIRNIDRATRLTVEKRNKSVAEIPEWEDMREKANQIRSDVIRNLYQYLDDFEKNAVDNGIIVNRTKDAEEANLIAKKIAKEHNAKLIVKAKSMLTEEIGFNSYMIKEGYDVIETDLGEYILQIANEPPSHLIGPAIHKSRSDIGKLFSEKLGVPYSEDPKFLTETAKNIIREKFFKADIGVSGANFGIVENGGIAIVENEGNARMCFTVPKIHIAFIGMERLLPRVKDLSLFLPLLSRSANGQKMTSYVTMLTGPRKKEAYDGPEKTYYIIVDNKRSTFLEDEKLKEALYCIRCSACYNVCPVYQNIGGHAYGWVYQGPIGAIITPQLLGLENAPDLPFASSLCGSCTDVCPVKIPLHNLLLHQRKRIISEVKTSTIEKMMFKAFGYFTSSSSKFQRAGNWGRIFQKLFLNKTFVPGWSKTREFPKLAEESFNKWWREKERNNDDGKSSH